MVKNGNFRFLLLEIILAYQLADLLPLVDLPVDLKGNFRFLLLEIILADQLAGLTPSRSASGSEGQFQISTVRDHIGISTSRSTLPVDLPVDLKGNFRFLLLEIILADQLAHLTPSTGM